MDANLNRGRSSRSRWCILVPQRALRPTYRESLAATGSGTRVQGNRSAYKTLETELFATALSRS